MENPLRKRLETILFNNYINYVEFVNKDLNFNLNNQGEYFSEINYVTQGEIPLNRMYISFDVQCILNFSSFKVADFNRNEVNVSKWCQGSNIFGNLIKNIEFYLGNNKCKVNDIFLEQNQTFKSMYRQNMKKSYTEDRCLVMNGLTQPNSKIFTTLNDPTACLSYPRNPNLNTSGFDNLFAGFLNQLFASQDNKEYTFTKRITIPLYEIDPFFDSSLCLPINTAFKFIINYNYTPGLLLARMNAETFLYTSLIPLSNVNLYFPQYVLKDWAYNKLATNQTIFWSSKEFDYFGKKALGAPTNFTGNFPTYYELYAHQTDISPIACHYLVQKSFAETPAFYTYLPNRDTVSNNKYTYGSWSYDNTSGNTFRTLQIGFKNKDNTKLQYKNLTSWTDGSNNNDFTHLNIDFFKNNYDCNKKYFKFQEANMITNPCNISLQLTPYFFNSKERNPVENKELMMKVDYCKNWPLYNEEGNIFYGPINDLNMNQFVICLMEYTKLIWMDVNQNVYTERLNSSHV